MNEEDVVLGRRVKARPRKSAGAMLCVRLPSALVGRLSEEARRDDTTLSAIVRRYLEPTPSFTESSSSAKSLMIGRVE